MYCAISKSDCKKGSCMFWVPSGDREEEENEHCVIVSGMLALRTGLIVYTTDA